jgi:hypothetical protein
VSAAWRQPIVWLMSAIPLATVVAGFATLHAARADGMDAEPEAVRRTAQAQEADLAPDLRAARLGLRATLRVDAGGRPVVAFARDAALTLRLVHPTRTDGDLEWKSLPLRRPREVEFSGPPVPTHARGRWVLEDTRHAWRLVGRWPQDGGAARLEPAVEAP